MTEKVKFHDVSGDSLKTNTPEAKMKISKSNISFFATLQKEPLVMMLLTWFLIDLSQEQIYHTFRLMKLLRVQRLISLGTLSKCPFKTSKLINCK